MQTVAQSEQTKQTKPVAFRCPSPLQKRLRMRAIEDDSTIAEVCIRALEQYLGVAA